MKSKHSKLKKIGYIAVVMLFGCAFMWRCANIVAPQGGPKDTLPPRVMGVNPMFNTTDFKAKKISITFDEFVQIRDQQKEFFSSPMMAKQPNIYVRGRGIVIEIKDDSLMPNTTYSLNFGNSIRDNNEGNPLNGFRYVFSTGPEIDSMYMSAYAADAFRGDSVPRTLFYFFPAGADSIPEYDSLMFKAKPVAIVRSENNGIAIGRNLKPIPYRIYAMQDVNNNFTYEPGIDKIGFLNEVFNPVDMPDFTAWYDTTRMYLTAQPQLYFRMFTDQPFRRQVITKFQRPEQHKITIIFGAPNPKIDSIGFDGIDPKNIITEYASRGKDTINYWLNTPTALLPDTIIGYIRYERHDSINQLYTTADTLKFIWKFTETREQKRQREEAEKEENHKREEAEKAGTIYTPPVVPTKFKYSGGAQSELIPDLNINYEFTAPLGRVDTTLISLIRLGDEDKRYRVRYTFRQDTAQIRRWTLAALWQTGQKYELTIAQGAFTDAAGEQNDTIKNTFTIADPEKFGKLVVNIEGKTSDAKYILQLYDPTGRQLIAEKRNVTTGSVIFTYLRATDMKLLIIEDLNGNGRWDQGNLVNQIQPERVETYIPESGNEIITIKVNWEMEININMAEMFAPIDIQQIRHQLAIQEAARAKRLVEERAKRAAQQQQQRGQNQQSGMNGLGGIGGGSLPGVGGLQRAN